jgi:hypothetical protein
VRFFMRTCSHVCQSMSSEKRTRAENKCAELVERILADDFVGLDPLVSFFRKTEELASVSKNVGDYVFAKGNDVDVRIYGDAAVARGSESWEKRNGKRGRYVWTDTWIRRNGKWQIVAAVDVKVPEPAK